MNYGFRTSATLAVVVSAAFAVSACQQSTDRTANASANAAATNSFNVASAPATPAPAAAAPVPAAATGPLALPTDSNLPESCQRYIRELQTCLDALTGPNDAFNARAVRTSLESTRGTWALAQDDSYRARMCTANRESLPDMRALYQCAR